MTLSRVPATSWAVKWVPAPTAGSQDVWNTVIVPSANQVAQMLRTVATMQSRRAENSGQREHCWQQVANASRRASK